MSLKIINESNDPTIFDVSYKQNDVYQANYVKAYSEEEVKEYFKTKRQDAEYLGATNIGMRSVLKPGKPVIDLTKESNLNEDDARKNKFDFLDSWYGSLDDIIKDFENNGFIVDDINHEYATIEDSDENYYDVRFGGTERTITINKIELIESIIIENKEIIKENINEDKAKKDFDNLLEPFNGIDIKAINEIEDDEFDTKSYVANILPTNYNDWIETIKNSNEYEFDADFNDYVKYTDYGEINIQINDDYITIEVKYNVDNLNESKKLTEGGIYPVGLNEDANEALKNIIDELIGGDNKVTNVELIPSLGFGGAGRYWYAAKIELDDNCIINYINEEETPLAYKLLQNDELIINIYSDISIDCSANKTDYYDGVTLDMLTSAEGNSKDLDKESYIIGDKIIDILYNNEEKILEVLKNYEEIDTDELEDEGLEESLIKIEEKMTLDDYQRIIYDGLDNISALAESYDGAENDTNFEKLNLTFERIEEEIKFIKDKLLEFK